MNTLHVELMNDMLKLVLQLVEHFSSNGPRGS